MNLRTGVWKEIETIRLDADDPVMVIIEASLQPVYRWRAVSKDRGTEFGYGEETPSLEEAEEGGETFLEERRL